jgi:hypothetical protein
MVFDRSPCVTSNLGVEEFAQQPLFLGRPPWAVVAVGIAVAGRSLLGLADQRTINTRDE